MQQLDNLRIGVVTTTISNTYMIVPVAAIMIVPVAAIMIVPVAAIISQI